MSTSPRGTGAENCSLRATKITEGHKGNGGEQSFSYRAIHLAVATGQSLTAVTEYVQL